MQFAYNTFVEQLMSLLIVFFYFPIVFIVLIPPLFKTVEELISMKMCLEI